MEEQKRRVASAAVLVMALFALSRLLGVAREMLIAAHFGASAEYDAYLAAVRIPDILFTLIAGGALGSAFIPTFAGHFAQDDAVGGWRLAGAVINLLLIVSTVAAALVGLMAPLVVRYLLAPGFSAQQRALTVSLMRVMLAAPVFFGVSGVVMGILNARQHFLLPALAPSMLNLALIGAVIALTPAMGIRALAWGYLLGAVLHLVVQLPGLFWVRARLRSMVTLHHPGVYRILQLMGPRVLGLAAVQANFLVNTNLASRLGAGAISAINYAWILMLLPQGVFAQAVGTAVFPTFAEQAAQEERSAMRATLAATLRAIISLSVPATVGLILLGEPLVALLFERGAFQAASTEMVTWALGFYALGLVGHAGLEVIARAFYALQDTLTPVWVNVSAMVVNLVLSLLLMNAFAWLGLLPHGGLALANSIATLMEAGGLLLLIWRRLGGIEGRRTLTAGLKSVVASAAMGAALLGWRAVLAERTAWIVGGVGILLGLAVYGVVAVLLQARGIREAVRLARRRRVSG